MLEVHTELPDNLDLLGQDPYGEGWILKIRLADPSQLEALMDQAGYDKVISEGSH